MLRGDIVKDDSGYHAVFTEQGSSASQMTAAKAMDIISRLPSRLPGCAGQAADAVSAYTQVKMEDAPSLLKIPGSECPDIWIRLPKHKWPKSWSSMEDPVVPLERNLYGHPLAGLLWERQFEKVFVETRLGKSFFNWACLFVNFLSVFVDDVKVAGKKQNINPTWKILVKGEPTSFLDHVYVGSARRECQKSKDIVDNYRNMFESRISDGAVEKLPVCEKLDANISSWTHDMEGQAKKRVERNCEMANTKTQQLYKVETPCLDVHQFKEEENGIRWRMSKVCSQILLKCLHLARIGRRYFMVREQTCSCHHKMDPRACDKRLSRLISYVHHTSKFKQCCLVGNTAQQCSLGLFQDSEFAGDLEDSKSTSSAQLSVWVYHLRGK